MNSTQLRGTVEAKVGPLVRMVEAIQEERITFLAAGIAYYAALSVVPLLVLALIAGSIFGGEAFAGAIIDALAGQLTPETEQLLEDAIVGARGRGELGLIGVAVFVWGGLRVFRGLDIAFSEVYGEASDPTFLTSLRNAIVVLSAIGLGFVGIFVIRSTIRMLELSMLVQVLSPIIVFLALSILFFPMYLVFPGIPQHPRDVVPGTILAAVGWTLLGELFGLYAANAGTYALFGVLGGFLLMLVWFYLGAILLLLGAVANAVLSGQYRPATGQENP